MKRTIVWVTIISGLATIVGGVVAAMTYYKSYVKPPPPQACQNLASIGWAGWNCSPAKPEVMIHGCADTKSITWLTDQLLRLNDSGTLQLPFQPFKLVPSVPDADGRIVTLWFCSTTDSDDDCRGHQTRHEAWHSVWVGESTPQGNAIRLTHSSAGFSNQAVYLDEGGTVWCTTQGPSMTPIALK